MHGGGIGALGVGALHLFNWLVRLQRLPAFHIRTDTEKHILIISYFWEKILTRRFPTLSCALAHFSQIGAFQLLRRDCTRLRDRRMTWIVLKGRAVVFLSYIEA